jgi:hypothetical protein
VHTEILTAAQHAVPDGLSKLASAREFYLAGGTALALRHEHRRSIDFDFFRPSAFDTYDLLLTLERAFDDLERLRQGRRGSAWASACAPGAHATAAVADSCTSGSRSGCTRWSISPNTCAGTSSASGT